MKLEFESSGRVKKAGPNARMTKMYGVARQQIVTLYTFRIDGRIHFRTSSFGLRPLAPTTFEAVFTTRDEAVSYANPGKRSKGWILNCIGDIQEVRVAKDGTLYYPDGARVNWGHKKPVHKSEKAAKESAIATLRNVAEENAAALRRLRWKIRKLKSEL